MPTRRRASVKGAFDIVGSDTGLMRYPVGHPSYPTAEKFRGTEHEGKAHVSEISVWTQGARPMCGMVKAVLLELQALGSNAGGTRDHTVKD